VDGVAASTDAEGASDAVPGATRPFIIVFALAGALLTDEAPVLPPQPARTSTPISSTTPAAALPERRAIAVTSRIAHPPSPAHPPDEKPVERIGLRGIYLVRRRSQKVLSPFGRTDLSSHEQHVVNARASSRHACALLGVVGSNPASPT